MVIVVKRYNFGPSGGFLAPLGTVAINPPEAVPGSTWVQWGQPAFDERGATVGWWLREDEPERCDSIMALMQCAREKGHAGSHSCEGVKWPQETAPMSLEDEPEKCMRSSPSEMAGDCVLLCELPKGHDGVKHSAMGFRW